MYKKSKIISEKRYNKEIKRAETIYVVVHYAKWCIREYKLAGFKRNILGRAASPLVPLVYYWSDCNGIKDVFSVCPLRQTITGSIYNWFFTKEEAEKTLRFLEEKTHE